MTRTAPLTIAASLGAALAVAEPGDVSWELIRPTNTGVPGDYTQVIFIDDDNSPWVGGYTPFWEEGGISHFDGTNWRVLGNVDCDQIISPRFNDVVKTDDGIMWIGSDNGLLRFDPAQEPWCVTRYHAGNTPLTGNQITDLAIAPDGTLWLASQEVGGSSAGGLAQFDYVDNTWEFWDTTNGLPWWAGWNRVDRVAAQADAAGGYTIWFWQDGMGLCTYKDGLFTWYGSATPPDVDPLPTSVAGQKAVDDAGNLLLMTDQGLAKRSPDGSYEIIEAAPVDLTSISELNLMPSGRVVLGTFHADVFLWDGSWQSLGNWGSGNHTYAFAEEPGGAIWAGGIGGSSRYENGAWQRYRLTNTGMLDFFPRDVALASNGDAAMTANAAPGTGGFDILHPDSTWTNANVATYGLGLPWPYPTDNTSAVEFRENGNLLFAPTNNGLREYDGSGFIDRIATTHDIEHIAIAGNGRAWAASGQSAAFTENEDGIWDRQFGHADGVPVGDMAGIVADPNDPNRVFIGAQFGIAHTDGATWEMIPRETFGLTLDTLGHHIYAFDVDEQGRIWSGSGLGLRRYDPATGELVVFDTGNAPIPSDSVFNVEIAPDGSIWISMFGNVFPYPGGVAQLKEGEWRVWQQGSSPLPHNQIWDLESRAVPGGYQVWIACASEAVAVITVEGDGPAGCNPADVAEPFGVLDLADVQTFISAFTVGEPAADLAPPAGVLDLADVQAFVAGFNAGCP